MKWMLLVLIFGTFPVETGLLFNDLDECLNAEEAMRGEYARAYNTWHRWAQANPKEAAYPESQKFQRQRLGMDTTATCIPYAERVPSPN